MSSENKINSWHYHCSAVVLTDLLPGSDSNSIEVSLIELTSLTDGVLSANRQKQSVSGLSDDGSTYTITLSTSNSVPATWLPLGSNRLTAPNVRRGEEVWIYKYGDSKQLFWTPTGRTDERRTTETIIYGIGARPDASQELDPSKNMYTVEMSSDGKHITVNTSKANGEPFQLTLQINAGDGVFTLTNHEGVDVEVDFVNDIILAKNASEQKIEMRDVNLFVDVPNKVKGVVGKGGVEVDSEGPCIVRAPKMQFGQDANVQKSVLGDTHASAHQQLEQLINTSQVIGNLGIPTSTIAAVREIDVPALKPNGASYSTRNTNQ